MANVVTLPVKTNIRRVNEILDTPPTLLEEIFARPKEWNKNKWLEIMCIVASDAGNMAGTSLTHLYGMAIEYANIVGAAAGIGAGAGYASWHIRRGARNEGRDSSNYETFSAVGATESGCIAGTTLVNAGAGLLASDYPFLSPEAAFIRVGGWLLSWPIGTAAMSELTLLQRIRLGRLITDKGTLPDLRDHLESEFEPVKDEFPSANISRGVNGFGHNYLRIHGRGSNLDIVERTIPKGYMGEHNPESNSLYVVKSKLNKYRDVKEPLLSYVDDSFGKVGRITESIESSGHNHSHEGHDH